LLYENEADFSARTDDNRKDAYWAAWREYVGAMKHAGVTLTPKALQSGHTGTTIRKKEKDL
jgi:hypothetical protein